MPAIHAISKLNQLQKRDDYINFEISVERFDWAHVDQS